MPPTSGNNIYTNLRELVFTALNKLIFFVKFSCNRILIRRMFRLETECWHTTGARAMCRVSSLES